MSAYKDWRQHISRGDSFSSLCFEVECKSHAAHSRNGKSRRHEVVGQCILLSTSCPQVGLLEERTEEDEDKKVCSLRKMHSVLV